jgi:hypothetical protein
VWCTGAVTVYVVCDESIVIYKQEDIFVFDVLEAIEGRGGWHGKWIGTVRPNLEWQTELLEENQFTL